MPASGRKRQYLWRLVFSRVDAAGGVRKLERKEKIFIAIGIVLTLFACGGLYLNHQLDRLATALSRPGLLFEDTEENSLSVSDPEGAPGTATVSENPAPEGGSHRPKGDAGAGSESGAGTGSGGDSSGEGGSSSGKGSSSPNPDGTPPGTLPGSQAETASEGGTQGDGTSHSNQEISDAVQEKVDQPLEKKDLLRAGLIILRKLDKEEIGYLYRTGTKDSYTREELQHVRKILLGKLTAQEIETLKEIGDKYGKKLRILDADVPIGGE